MIGDYRNPRVRLPGAGGAPEIAAHARETLLILRHERRALVERLDFCTTAGHLEGGDSRLRLGFKGRGPTRVVTDLCILEPHPQTRELQVSSLHPGVEPDQVVEATGWPIRFAEALARTPEPSREEIRVLRELERRSREERDGAA